VRASASSATSAAAVSVGTVCMPQLETILAAPLSTMATVPSAVGVVDCLVTFCTVATRRGPSCCCTHAVHARSISHGEEAIFFIPCLGV